MPSADELPLLCMGALGNVDMQYEAAATFNYTLFMAADMQVLCTESVGIVDMCRFRKLEILVYS